MDPLQPAINVQQLQGVFGLYSSGRIHEALAAATSLLREHPREPVLLTLLGAIHTSLTDYDAAEAHLRQVIELRPDVADGHFFLGNTLLEKGAPGPAAECFERAIALRPGYLDAHNKLCQSYERGNRLEALGEALARARLECPGEHAPLALREAEFLKRRGEIAAARERLESSDWRNADADTRETAAYLLSDLADRLDDARAAFAFADEANRICRAGFQAQRTDSGAYLRFIDKLTETFGAHRAGDWPAIEVDDSRADPVFLVGFPRSGTTLLDTILSGHPDITVLDEVPTIFRLEQAFHDLAADYDDGLRKLDADRVLALRDVYFEQLDKHVAVGDRATRVVDKLALNVVQAGLIHRVFPGAQFIFAQRHPCDVVLSCFMRAFKVNDGMAHFLDLGDAARLYDRVMRLWMLYREKLPLAVHTIRYESLVGDLEATIAPCLEFLGLDWHDGVADYRTTASRRAAISTPSYNQVTEPLYGAARGRWLRYRDDLQPVLPVLLPWAEHWGYES